MYVTKRMVLSPLSQTLMRRVGACAFLATIARRSRQSLHRVDKGTTAPIMRRRRHRANVGLGLSAWE